MSLNDITIEFCYGIRVYGTNTDDNKSRQLIRPFQFSIETYRFEILTLAVYIFK